MASKKVWICLYTCCVVRAVHLDLVPDMSTPAFLRSFRRFTARRGLPCKMLSDNAKTFRAAAKSLTEVKWIFNVPKAPWWGGVFEWMVRCTKRCLRKIIGQAKFMEPRCQIRGPPTEASCCCLGPRPASEFGARRC